MSLTFTIGHKTYHSLEEIVAPMKIETQNRRFEVRAVAIKESEQPGRCGAQPRGLKIRGSYSGKSKQFFSPPQRPYRLLRLHSLLVS
jgi:hypothetical protein